MASSAQLAANRVNAEASTGPRSDEGKVKVSQNTLVFGLFSKRDFVRLDERSEYGEMRAGLWRELSPTGALEEAFAMEILSAAWRLRRCGLVEGDLAGQFAFDPMTGEDEAAARIQTSIDRARSHAHNCLRKSLAGLRRLQTERAIRDHLPSGDPPLPISGIADSKQVISTLNQDLRRKAGAAKIDELDRFELACSLAPHSAAMRHSETSMPAEGTPELGLFCKKLESVAPVAPPAPAGRYPAKEIPRGAPCPCGSGLKYKRCCGRNAPAILQTAA